MDVFFGDYSCQERYEFYIEQVPATNYYDSHYWDLNVLRKVINKNVSCSGWDCTFTWEEIKEEGKNFIYIFPPAPFSDFYTFWGEKIKINHLGGLSAGAIAGIVIGCVFFLAIVITLISVCYCCAKGKRCYNCCPCCACCCCRRPYEASVPVPVGIVNVQVQQPVYPTPVPVVNYGVGVPPHVYPDPAYPAQVYQPGIASVPYSSGAFV